MDEQTLRFQNRLRYDPLAYKAFLRQSTSPLAYQTINLPYHNDTNCAQDQPGYFARQNSAVPLNPGTLTNVESELFGLFRRLSDAPEDKYSPFNTKASPCSDKGTLDGNCYPVRDLDIKVCSIPITNLPKPFRNSGLPPLPPN